ncbi:MAG: pilus assembly protein PilM, partial [Candidatus Omnitrophota bacterium]
MNKPNNLLSFFNAEPIIGLDIDKNHVRLASAFINSDGKVVVDKLGSLEYDSGASQEEVASSLKRLWRDKHIKTHTVQSCLRSQSIITKYFKLPTVLREEVDSALRLEAEQVFQKPPEEIFIDWHLYSSNNQLNKEKHNSSEGFFVAALAKDINKHLSILQKADLYPVIVDVGCMAISNLFLALESFSKTESVCLVSVN